MATIRMAIAAGAALIALMAIVPTASHAQAPLQLVPGPNQAKKTTDLGRTNDVGRTRAAAKKKSTAQTTSNKSLSRQTAAVTRPGKAARSPARPSANTTASTLTSRRQSEPTANAQRARVAGAARAKRTVAVAQRPVLRRPSPASSPDPSPAPQVVAQGGDEHVTSDNVLRGSDSVSLVALLPWWRNDQMQDVTYGSDEAKSKVMAAAEAWLAAHGGRAVDDDGVRTAAGTDETFDVADAEELNEIDLTAPPPPEPSFLQSLIALLGSAIAAAAASARLLFA